MAGKRRKRSINGPCLAKRSRREAESKKRFSLIPKLTDFTLPGFHYLGPGSSKDNGPPTNDIDAIAKKHDEAYDQVVDEFKQTHDLKRSVEEIEKADQQFLETMRKTRATTAKEALGKTVGLVGIGLKAAVEKSLGYTLYPNLTNMTNNGNPNCDDNVVKIRAGDDFN